MMTKQKVFKQLLAMLLCTALVVALFAGLGIALPLQAKAATVIDVSNLTEGDQGDYEYSTEFMRLLIKADGVTLTGSNSDIRVTVESNVTALTLDNLTLGGEAYTSISANGEDVTLTLKGENRTNRLFGHDNLTIQDIDGESGTASLTATCGIHTNKNITINSGTIVATGIDLIADFSNSYGIASTGSGTLTINGGNITATSGSTATGSNYNASVALRGNHVLITGGVVNAASMGTEGNRHFGILAAWSLTITGGTVTATGGTGAAILSAGLHSRDRILISGGTVTATGGTTAASPATKSAGISIDSIHPDSHIEVTGGTVTAVGEGGLGQAPYTLPGGYRWWTNHAGYADPGGAGTASNVAGYRFSKTDQYVKIQTDGGVPPDVTAPIPVAGTVKRIGDTKATVKFTSNEVGYYDYRMVADNAEEPTPSRFFIRPCAVGETTITNPYNLAAGDMDAWIFVRDLAGNIGKLKIDVPAYVPDTIPPTLTAGTITRTSSTEATVSFSSNKEGLWYYLVQDAAAAAPDAETIKSTGTTGSMVINNNTITLTAEAEKIYIVGEDEAGNLSAVLAMTIPAYTNPDQAKVAEDKAALTEDAIKGTNADRDNVTGNLTLPTTGSKGSSLTWESDQPDVISADGKVTRPAYGQPDMTVTLTATIKSGDVTDTVTITVIVKAETAPTVTATGVKLAQSSLRLAKKQKATIGAVVYFSDGSSTSDGLTWTSSNEKVAVVNSNGQITGKKAGKATITATTESGESATLKVTVVAKAVKVTKVAISGSKKPLDVGKTAQLKAKISPSKATNAAVTWKSSKPSVVHVDKAGKITALKEGKAVITLKAGGKTAKVTITVAAPVSKITVDKTKVSLAKKGKTAVITPTVTYSQEGFTAKLNWKSSNTKVATVNSKGKITAKGKGKATITVSAANGKSAKIKVTVKK